jgi:hypothetical protein
MSIAILLKPTYHKRRNIIMTEPVKQFRITLTRLTCDRPQQGEAFADEPYVLFGIIKPAAGIIPFALAQDRSSLFTQVDKNDQRNINAILFDEALADNGVAEDAIGVFDQIIERDRTTSGSLEKVVGPAQELAKDAFQDGIFEGITSVAELTSLTATALHNGVVAGGVDDAIGDAQQVVFSSADMNSLEVGGAMPRTLTSSGSGALYRVEMVLERTQ